MTTKHQCDRNTTDVNVIDRTQFRNAIHGVVDWGIDLAARATRGLAGPTAAVENVRAYLHSGLEGRATDVPPGDALLTIAIVLHEIERKTGMSGLVAEVLRPVIELAAERGLVPEAPHSPLPPGELQRAFARARARMALGEVAARLMS